MLRNGYNPNCLLLPNQLDVYTWAIVCLAGAATEDDWRMWFEFVSVMWEFHLFDPVQGKPLEKV